MKIKVKVKYLNMKIIVNVNLRNDLTHNDYVN